MALREKGLQLSADWAGYSSIIVKVFMVPTPPQKHAPNSNGRETKADFRGVLLL